MKNTTCHSDLLRRVAPPAAVALLSIGLGVVTASAQSGGATGAPPTHAGSSTSPSSEGASGSMGGTTGSQSATSATSDRGMSGSSSSASLDRSDRKFITKTAESNEKEVALAQLATERASDPQVKSYAQQLVSQHEQMGQQLAQLAQRKGVTLETHSASGTSMSGTAETSDSSIAPSPSAGTTTARARTNSSSGARSDSAMAASGPTSDRHYRKLAKKSGAEFDKDFVAMMKDDHKKDIEMFQKAAQGAADPDVRSFASQHLPDLQAHLDRVNTLGKSVAE